MDKGFAFSVLRHRRHGFIPGLGRSPGEGHGNPLQYYCFGESHGQRSLIGYSPEGQEESDTTAATEPHPKTHQ